MTIAPQVYQGIPWYTERADLTASTCDHCGSEIREYPYNLHYCHAEFLDALLAFGRPATKKQIPMLSKSTYNTGTQTWRWGLVKSESPTNRGPWFITDLGVQFRQGRIVAPSHCIIRMLAGTKSEIVRFEGQPMTFSQLRLMSAGNEIYDEKVEEQRRARSGLPPTPPSSLPFDL